MKLLHIDASARTKGSTSRKLTALFVERLRESLNTKLVVTRLDLAENPPAHVNELFTAAMYTPSPQRTPEMRAVLSESDRLCAQLLDSDAIVIGTPMYNFNVPSGLKAYIDNIVRGGLTYVAEEGRGYVGQLTDKRLLFITSRGVDFRPGSPFEHYDALTPALRAAFGFIGATQPEFIDAQPMQFTTQALREEAMERAELEVRQTADAWASSEQ